MLPEDSNWASHISAGKDSRQPEPPLCSVPHAEARFLTHSGHWETLVQGVNGSGAEMTYHGKVS